MRQLKVFTPFEPFSGGTDPSADAPDKASEAAGETPRRGDGGQGRRDLLGTA